MNSRLEFNLAVVKLLTRMIEGGESPVIDYVKRSNEEQKRLFDAGLSKCDGVSVISYHQFGRAVDIYFLDGGKVIDPINGFEYWHRIWDDLGGHKMLEWDRGHFQG